MKIESTEIYKNNGVPSGEGAEAPIIEFKQFMREIIGIMPDPNQVKGMLLSLQNPKVAEEIRNLIPDDVQSLLVEMGKFMQSHDEKVGRE